ncbi:imidazole glycerol phosphate synthase subunit HisH [Algivirga pacifica]|uniref:Imidazole glycerol phosphate synthase subunit HisH n=2 Tax=Algivirga pacifica TaxID=1162670 RepID=A0ABP9D9F4_9BACT
MMKVAIVKYNAGNVQSVIYALNRLGVNPIVTDDPELLQQADKVIFPGVGEASTAMAYLKERGLDQVIVNLKQPVLGICLGLQLMCKHSEEGDVDCLGIFDVDVKRFPANAGVKVPQMGWNKLHHMKGLLFEGLPAESYVYFVHSYYAALSPETAAQSTHAVDFSASLQKDNFYAMQFHPEKSSEAGSVILKNFLEL